MNNSLNVVQSKKSSRPTAKPPLLKMTECSFVKQRVGARKRKCGYNFWAVTPTDDYDADCKTGNSLAMEYLRFLRRHPFPLSLSWIALAMPRENDYSGIEVGFLGSITRAAALGSHYAGDKLPAIVALRSSQA